MWVEVQMDEGDPLISVETFTSASWTAYTSIASAVGSGGVVRTTFEAQGGKVYWVRVDSANGTAGQVKMDWVLGSRPWIVTEPVGKVVGAGAELRLGVGVTGQPAPNYIWKKDGDVLGGQTGPELVINTARVEDSGTYSVMASNVLGTAQSASVEVRVKGGIEGWRMRYFSSADLADAGKQSTVWGDEADSDRDGRKNLLEYALGLNPTKSEILSIEATMVSGKAQLKVKQRKNDSILTCGIEAGWSQGSFTSSGINILSESDIDSEFKWVTYQDSTSPSPGSPRYYRFKASIGSP